MIPGGLRTRKESSASLASRNPGMSNATRAKSPTFSTTTTASDMPFAPGLVITRADLRASIGAYDDLVGAVSSYRSALGTLSHASAKIARALEVASRTKGVSDEAAVGMQAAGGLHHVIANHEQVLGRSLQLNVEQPLRQHLETYKASVADRSAAYERTLIERSRLIRQTEKENMAIGRRRTRDLNSFRKTLSLLQSQVDDLDRLKAEYYESVLTHEEQVWDFVLAKVSYSVRTTLDVYDRVTAKSSDPHLEPLLLSIPDPFDTYGPPKSEEQIFSILPPFGLSMNLTSSPSSSPIPLNPPQPTGNGSDCFHPSISPLSASSSISPPSPPFITPPHAGVPSWMGRTPFATSSTAASSLVSGSGEWADARSASNPPPPSGGLPGPSSLSATNPARSPYSNGNGPGTNSHAVLHRSVSKAESKLRTVLSSASEDEGSNGRSHDGDVDDDDSDSDTRTEVDVGRSPRRPTHAERDENASEETIVWRQRSRTPVQGDFSTAQTASRPEAGAEANT